MNDVIVRVEHVRRANLCMRGVRDWFRANSLDLNHFLQHGYPASVLEQTGDALVTKVIEIARKEAQDNG